VRFDDGVGIAGRTRPHRRRTYVVLSTYPPTPCGIATFSAALCGGLASTGSDVGVVRLDPSLKGDDPVVRMHLDERRPDQLAAAVAALDDADVAIVQHEYGIYDGADGASVIDILERLTVPTIVVAHTVLRQPTPGQRAVLEAVVDAADTVVVMTEAGRRRMIEGFDVDVDKVTVIPHGAAVAPGRPRREERPANRVLTWGLLGPGKGIEWAIDAIAGLADVEPRVEYRIAGDTHPKVVERDGERYREMLIARAERAGIGAQVRFDAGYRGLGALAEMIEESSVVVLPYDSPDQVTSGVLVDAVAAGRPVIATAFPHAVELLASGAGLVVPQRDPDALADALRRVLTEPALAGAMAAEARRLGPGLAWPAVASRYAALGETLLTRRQAVPA
jgi:glycosyltransferase involved in cell wall biosynthesis